VAASLAFAVPAGADEADSSAAFFSAKAYSAPIGVDFYDAGAPLIPGEIVYGTVAVAKAAVDSVGNSAGFAGGPYLGDNVPALMGAFNAIGPFGAILPPYPFMVQSQYPGAPKQVQDSGPRHLAANSNENGSDSDAHVGLARGNPGLASVSATSKAIHDPATGVSTATADGVVEGFSVGPTLTIGQVVSHADVSAQPGVKPTKHTSLSIGSLTVMGTLVGLTDKGLVPGEDTDAGTDSAALIIGLSRDVPGGLMRVRIILGRVLARVDSGPAQG